MAPEEATKGMPKGLNAIQIDGAHGEGGGALLRTALAMAALTQQAVHITDVRGQMRRKGLASEDLTFLRALQASALGQVQGDHPGSRELVFQPKRAPRPVNERFEMSAHQQGTVPGNALIVIESLLPVLARAGGLSRLTVTGETYNPNTLTFDAFEHATLPAHRAQGLYAYPALQIAGFGFGARGEVTVEVEPSALQGIQWTLRGAELGCLCVIATAELPLEVAERGMAHAREQMRAMRVAGEVEHIEVSSRTPGAFATVVGAFERGAGAGCAMGARGVRMEKVVDEAFDAYEDWRRSGATVDAYLADQLLLPAVLASTPSAYTTPNVTQRLLTMAWTIKQFLPVAVTILGREGEPGTVRVKE
jgi:RNA 3'-terminal phosphate cyclase (ATP)